MRQVVLVRSLVLGAVAAAFLASCASAGPGPAAGKPTADERTAPERPAPAPAKPAPAQPGPLPVFLATGVSVTRNGQPVELPKELTGHRMYFRVTDGSRGDLRQENTGFGARFNFAFGPGTITLTLVNYWGDAQRLAKSFELMGLTRTTETFNLTLRDGTGILELVRPGSTLRVGIKRIE